MLFEWVLCGMQGAVPMGPSNAVNVCLSADVMLVAGCRAHGTEPRGEFVLRAR